jgi:type IV pilus assembly protein PilB
MEVKEQASINLLPTAKASNSDKYLEMPDMYSSFWKKVFIGANNSKASDIHIHQYENELRIQFRIHGEKVLFDSRRGEKSFRDQFINRLKQIVGFNLSVNDDAQDRAFSLKTTSSRYRGIITPAVFGEYVVFRIIREDDLPSLDNLNMKPDTLLELRNTLSMKQGFICITGPTGSGKSNTLQASLMSMKRDSKNIITIEDPIERILPDITQQQISNKLTWNKAIKSAMRQDPDVILIGEIRDRESASLALEAAQTGHLVLSTLHTNDASGVVDRLIGLGVEKRLIAENLLYVSAQRLLLLLCPICKKIAGDIFYTRGEGCDSCGKGKGVIGRIPIIEYFTRPNPESILSYSKSIFRKTELKTNLYLECFDLVKKGLVDCEELKNWEEYK